MTNLKYYRAYSVFWARFLPNDLTSPIRSNYPKKFPFNIKLCAPAYWAIYFGSYPIPSYSVLSRSLTWPPTCVYCVYTHIARDLKNEDGGKKAVRSSSTLFVFFFDSFLNARWLWLVSMERRTNNRMSIDRQWCKKSVGLAAGRMHAFFVEFDTWHEEGYDSTNDRGGAGEVAKLGVNYRKWAMVVIMNFIKGIA